MRAFIFLSKYIIEQEVDDDLFVCVDEHCPCGLSITGDIEFINVSRSKDNYVSTLNGEVHYGLLSRSCLYCPNLITVAPVTRDKEMCQSHVMIR